MLKKISLIILVAGLAVAFNSASGIDVSGDVWGVWTADNSPYNVVGSIRVPPDSSLIIEAGVQVLFCGECSLAVANNALIQADGTESDTIYFIGGKGIRLSAANNESFFRFCRIGDVSGDLSGAVVVAYSSIDIRNSLIANNWSNDFGGAISAIYASVLIEKCVVYFNYLGPEFMSHWNVARGGGIFASNSTLVVSKCIISRNIAEGDSGYGAGGGIFLKDSNAVLEFNTISRNYAHYIESNGYNNIYEGSGIYSYNSSVTINNNIIWGNTVSDVFTDGGSLEVTYSDIGDTIPGDGNIYSDPMFVDFANNDFHLLVGSPCINTGDPNSPLDPDSTRADMGALFYDFRTGVDEPIPLPEDFILFQNYPNPFNAATTISYRLPEASNVSIDVFDITGRKVSSLFEGQQDAGGYNITWDASGQVSGVYFYRLRAGNISEIKRCVLIK